MGYEKAGVIDKFHDTGAVYGFLAAAGRFREFPEALWMAMKVSGGRSTCKAIKRAA